MLDCYLELWTCICTCTHLFDDRLLTQLEEKRQGNKESSKERHQKVTDAQVAIEVSAL